MIQEFTSFDHQFFDSIARLWHDVFIDTYPHLASDHDLEGYRYILREHVLPECDLILTLDGGSVVGFLALKPNFIGQNDIPIRDETNWS